MKLFSDSGISLVIRHVAILFRIGHVIVEFGVQTTAFPQWLACDVVIKDPFRVPIAVSSH